MKRSSKMKKCCNFPEYENNSMFSLQDEYNYFLETNTRYTSLGKLEDFSLSLDRFYISFDWFEYMPMGYTNIYLYERQAIIENGSICWENLTVKNSFEGLGKYYILDSDCKHLPENFDKLEESVSFSIQVSKDNGNRYLIIRSLGWEYWH